MGNYILFLTVTVLQRLGEASKAVGVEGDEDQRKRMVSLLNRNKKALQSSRRLALCAERRQPLPRHKLQLWGKSKNSHMLTLSGCGFSFLPFTYCVGTVQHQ